GYPAAVPVTLTKSPAAVEVTALIPPLAPGQPPPPSSLPIKPATAAANASAVSLTITPPLNASEATVDLLLQGKSKINNVDKTAPVPAISVNVKRPFAVDFLTPALTLKPGQTVALKGRLRRQPVFKEPVELNLAGLPAGVTVAVPLKPIPGNGAEFQIDLKAD